MSGIYLGSLIPILMFAPKNWSEIELVQTWAMIFFGSYAPFAVYGLISIKRNYGIDLPWVSILKYSLVTLLASVILFYLSDTFLEYKTSIWEFLPEIIPLVAISGIIYLGLTYLIDNSTRSFFKSILNEFRK